MDILTIPLTTNLTIKKQWGFYRVSVKARGGTVSIIGNVVTLKVENGDGTTTTLTGGSIVLADGQGSVYQASVTSSAIELTITPEGGATADLELFYG